MPSSMLTNSDYFLNRRAFLRVSAGGLGSLALTHLLGLDAPAASLPARALATAGQLPEILMRAGQGAGYPRTAH